MAEPAPEPLPEDLQRTYLGDGVYARFDGYQIWVEVQGLSRGIALESQVLAALFNYDARIKEHFNGG